jgi:hypothetical protein
LARGTDLLVHGHSSVYLLRATSRRGQLWLDEHIFDDHQEWAGAIVVEHRYVVDIVAGAREAGLEMR